MLPKHPTTDAGTNDTSSMGTSPGSASDGNGAFAIPPQRYDEYASFN